MSDNNSSPREWWEGGIFDGPPVPVNDGECRNALQMGRVVCVREDHVHTLPHGEESGGVL